MTRLSGTRAFQVRPQRLRLILAEKRRRQAEFRTLNSLMDYEIHLLTDMGISRDEVLHRIETLQAAKWTCLQFVRKTFR
jgi:uncharacterized protein YjiS (DUF1127 family)